MKKLWLILLSCLCVGAFSACSAFGGGTSMSNENGGSTTDTSLNAASDNASEVETSDDSTDDESSLPEEAEHHYGEDGVCRNCKAMVQHEHPVSHSYTYDTERNIHEESYGYAYLAPCQYAYIMEVACEECDYAVEIFIQGAHPYDDEGICEDCHAVADWHEHKMEPPDDAWYDVYGDPIEFYCRCGYTAIAQECEHQHVYDENGVCRYGCGAVESTHEHVFSEEPIDDEDYNVCGFCRYACCFCGYVDENLSEQDLNKVYGTAGVCECCGKVADWHVHNMVIGYEAHCEGEKTLTRCEYDGIRCGYVEETTATVQGHTYTEDGICQYCYAVADWHTCRYEEDVWTDGTRTMVAEDCLFEYCQDKHVALGDSIVCNCGKEWVSIFDENADCLYGEYDFCYHCGAHTCAMVAVCDENGNYTGEVVCVYNDAYEYDYVALAGKEHLGETKVLIELGHCYDENGICAECGKEAEWFNNKSE